MSKEIVMFDRWLELPSDLLREIVKHLHSSKDYVRFRAVCKSWNLDLPKIPNHIRGPWLVLPFNDETFGIEEKDFYLRLPEMRNNFLRGSFFGWLVSVETDGVLRMLNPFTKAQLHLPPMSTFPNIVDYRPDMTDAEYTIRDLCLNGELYTSTKSHVQKNYLQKIIISSSPDDDKQDFMAIAIYGKHFRLALCKFSDNKWTDFSIPGIINCGLEDAIFYEGKIYGIDWRTKLYEFDVETSMGGNSEVPKPDDLNFPDDDMYTHYLVRSVEGNLLMVRRHLTYHEVGSGEDEVSFFKTTNFDIYKLDESAKRWTRIFNLGNYVLIVGYNSSICTLPVPDGKGNWVRNCIYFTDNNFTSQYWEIGASYDVGVFHLEDGRVDELFPNSKVIYPSPIWLFSQNFTS